MEISKPTNKVAKFLRQEARKSYLARGKKAVAKDFRVVTIVWVCIKGCMHPEPYAFHKSTKSVADLEEEYYDYYEDIRVGKESPSRVDGYRFSNAGWMLLDPNDPPPPNGEILYVNHVRYEEVWVVNYREGPPKEEKRCFWCFQPKAKEKCSWCIEDALENPQHVIARYCNRDCQKAAWQTHRKEAKDYSRECAFCLKPGVRFTCKRCKVPSYCSKECHEKHWPQHHPECKEEKQ